jgi:probable HAF family extracellular repeat protein
MVDLGTLPGKGTAKAEAINDHGQVVGTSGEQGSYSYAGRAFSWTQAGGMVDLGILPGGDYSQAQAVNNNGQVVGDSGTFFAGPYLPPGATAVPVHAFLWTQAGGMVDLGTLPGAATSVARGINDQGQVVGTSGGRPFLWSQATGMTELGLLPGDKGGVATAINNQGQVVGSSYSDTRSHAVLWGGDTTAPTAQLRVLRGQKLSGVRSRGLRLQLTLSEPGSTEIVLTRGKRQLATKTVTVTTAVATAVTFKLDREVRLGLRRLSKATFTVRTSARDLAGNSGVTTTRFTIKR